DKVAENFDSSRTTRSKLQNAVQSTPTSNSICSCSTEQQSGGDGSVKTTAARLGLVTSRGQRHIVFAGTYYKLTTMNKTAALTRQENDTQVNWGMPVAQSNLK
ncbi:hypothetical protein DFQ26_000410, partial [Actinomortierella ambigua]